jgi:hypothetical protein
VPNYGLVSAAKPGNLSDTLPGRNILYVCLLFLAFTLRSFADASTGLELRDACRATHLGADAASVTTLQVMKMVVALPMWMV